MKQRFYVGTYTRPILFGTGEILEGEGKGIYLAEADTERADVNCICLAAQSDNPSYLALSNDGQNLYAVNELKEYCGATGGAVSAYRVCEDGKLALLNELPTGGTDPCFVAADPLGECIVVANFMSGSVAVYPLADDGSLKECSCFVQHTGASVHPSRQRGPHAHAAVFDPDSRFVLVPDLGTDSVNVYALDRLDYSLRSAFTYRAEAGSGPRYCEFHLDLPLCYLINELGSSVSVLRFDNQTGVLERVQTVTTLPNGFVGDNICADLHVCRNGERLYASNRGHNSIVAFDLDANGRMQHAQAVPCGGRTPRNFTVCADDRSLLVGNQDSDNLVLFELSAEGELRKKAECSMPTPVCVKAAVRQRKRNESSGCGG